MTSLKTTKPEPFLKPLANCVSLPLIDKALLTANSFWHCYSTTQMLCQVHSMLLNL